MELEQRVKTLEYEMKILKNEVQRTLLDIQEQVLVHYYPSLRTEDSSPPESTLRSLDSIREKKGALGPSPLTQARKVFLEEVRTAQKGTPTSPEGESSSQSEEEESQTTILKLSGWVSSTAQKIGGERTAKIIQACTDKGILAPEFEHPLLRLTGLIDGSNAPEQVAINEVLDTLMKLNELLGREANVEDALSLIEEAKLG